MSSVLRFDKSSKLATDDHEIPATARVVIEHTACRLVVCLFGHSSECVEIAASRSSVCTAVNRFGLHSYFVSESCLPPTANRFPSAEWIRRTVRDIRDSRMIAGPVTVTHMSDAGLGASLKLITHLHNRTKPFIVSAP